MKFYIETERLAIRAFQESDLDAMFQLDSNPEVHRYLGNKPVKSKADALEKIKHVMEQYEKFGIGRFTCIEKSSGDIIGWSGLKFNTGEKEELNGFRDFIDIGYRFIPEYWRKGYGYESAVACLDFGFNTMNYDIIYGAADINNIGSNKILKKIGLHFVNEFLYENERINWYELKKEDYAG